MASPAVEIPVGDRVVRVTNPDVGGGFGMKGMTYPEYIAIAAASRALSRRPSSAARTDRGASIGMAVAHSCRRKARREYENGG